MSFPTWGFINEEFLATVRKMQGPLTCIRDAHIKLEFARKPLSTPSLHGALSSTVVLRNCLCDGDGVMTWHSTGRLGGRCRAQSKAKLLF